MTFVASAVDWANKIELVKCLLCADLTSLGHVNDGPPFTRPDWDEL